jgi:SAM-dependent methyltransferase
LESRKSILEQYKNSNRLSERVRFHQEYSQAPLPFLPWALERIRLTGDETVLDAGCGTGVYLFPIAEKLREKGGIIVGMDLSGGILEDLKEKAASYPNVKLVQGDLQQTLPFASETFDIVMANFVLYHVEDIPHAIRELKRVLKPGGHLYIATGSQKNLEELEQLNKECKHLLGFPSAAVQQRKPYTRFSIENGAAFLRPHFAWFELHALYDQIVVHEAEPVLQYYASGMMERGIELGTELRKQISDAMMEELYHLMRQKIQKIIDREGMFRLQKQTGYFVCRKPD